MRRFLADLEQAPRWVFVFAVAGIALTFTKVLVLAFWCVERVTR